MRARASFFVLAVGVAAAPACATIADSQSPDQDLPSAGLGPFRPITSTELANAPNAEDDVRHRLRDAAILDLDGDPTTREVWGFFAANVADLTPPPGATPSVEPAPDEIVRSSAPDGRSFDSMPVLVLTPMSPWEGGTVGAPSVLRVGTEIFLYYAAKGGIGLARSPDGTKFTSSKAAVLAPLSDASSWEDGATPASPSVVRLPDGSFRMFYEIAGSAGAKSLGGAISADGATWARASQAPVLAPSPHGDPAAADAPYDDLSVGSPFAITGTTEEGTAVVRVYYGAHDSSGNVVIGLAARFGNDGPLTRATAPVYGTGSTLAPHEPCVLVADGYSLLFVTEHSGKTDKLAYSAVAVGVAPALVTLPPPSAM